LAFLQHDGRVSKMVRRKSSGISGISTRLLMKSPVFHSSQAEELAQAFNEAGVEYLFLGKSAAILLGYPGTTQDVDVFPQRTPENGQRIVTALKRIGFQIDSQLEQEILAGKDFVQIKNGPFDLDLIFAPDGIPDFKMARERVITFGIFPIANLRDIIASKKASGRKKDLNELPLLESFRDEYEKKNPPSLKSAADIAAKRKPRTEN